MGSRSILKVLLGIVLSASAGCGSGSTEETHLADLPAPTEQAIAAAKAKAQKIVLPKTRFSSSGMTKAEKAEAPPIQQ
jgi:hypothetical protein